MWIAAIIGLLVTFSSGFVFGAIYGRVARNNAADELDEIEKKLRG